MPKKTRIITIGDVDYATKLVEIMIPTSVMYTGTLHTNAVERVEILYKNVPLAKINDNYYILYSDKFIKKVSSSLFSQLYNVSAEDFHFEKQIKENIQLIKDEELTIHFNNHKNLNINGIVYTVPNGIDVNIKDVSNRKYKIYSILNELNNI